MVGSLPCSVQSSGASLASCAVEPWGSCPLDSETGSGMRVGIAGYLIVQGMGIDGYRGWGFLEDGDYYLVGLRAILGFVMMTFRAGQLYGRLTNMGLVATQ